MPERVKLQEPGSELVMTVSKVTPETVENTEYWLFSNGHKELLVPKSSVASQLDRLGEGVISPLTDIAGKTVKFSRSAKLNKYGKPFWNLDLATEAERSSVGGEAEKPGQLASVSATPPSTPSDSPAKKVNLGKLYLMSTEYVLGNIVPLYTKAEIGVSDTSVAAMTATLFIAAAKTWQGEEA